MSICALAVPQFCIVILSVVIVGLVPFRSFSLHLAKCLCSRMHGLKVCRLKSMAFACERRAKAGLGSSSAQAVFCHCVRLRALSLGCFRNRPLADFKSRQAVSFSLRSRSDSSPLCSKHGNRRLCVRFLWRHHHSDRPQPRDRTSTVR
jgi:hypothetical protein